MPNSPYILIADCRAGFIFRFNTESLELTKYFDHPLLKPIGTLLIFGVNGLKLSRGYLYFSNTNQEFVARIKASGAESSLSGTPETVASGMPFDDFIVNESNGDLYLTAGGEVNSLGFFREGSGAIVPEILIGRPNTTELLFSTAAIWAKDAEGRLLIVPKAGGLNQFTGGNVTGSAGRLCLVHVGEL